MIGSAFGKSGVFLRGGTLLKTTLAKNAAFPSFCAVEIAE